MQQNPAAGSRTMTEQRSDAAPAGNEPRAVSTLGGQALCAPAKNSPRTQRTAAARARHRARVLTDALARGAASGGSECAGAGGSAGALICAASLALAPAPAQAAAQQPPQVPMPLEVEHSAEFRWLNKPVLASRVLDDISDPATWRFQGTGTLTPLRDAGP